METRSRQFGPGMTPKRLNLAELNLWFVRELRTSVKMTSLLPDLQKRQRLLATGYVFIDVFCTTVATPLTSKFLEESLMRLQRAIASWLKHKQDTSQEYLWSVMGPDLLLKPTSMSFNNNHRLDLTNDNQAANHNNDNWNLYIVARVIGRNVINYFKSFKLHFRRRMLIC